MKKKSTLEVTVLGTGVSAQPTSVSKGRGSGRKEPSKTLLDLPDPSQKVADETRGSSGGVYIFLPPIAHGRGLAKGLKPGKPGIVHRPVPKGSRKR